LVFSHKDHFEILAGFLEREGVSAVVGGKLELPGQGVPKLELGNEGDKGNLEILAGFLEREGVSAVAGGKLELPGQGVPKLELGNEGKERAFPSWSLGTRGKDLHPLTTGGRLAYAEAACLR
jgi:hypothetical protein